MLRGWKGFTEYRDKGEPDKGWDYNPADSQDDRLDQLIKERQASCNVGPHTFGRKDRGGGMFNANCSPKAAKMLDSMSAMLGKNTVNETFIRQSIGDVAWNAAVADFSARVLPPEVASAGLTMAEKVALYTWTLDTSQGSWFARINRVLRLADVSSAEIADVQPLVDGIQSALEKLPPFEGVVYRAVKQAKMQAEEWSAFISQFVVDGTVSLQGFSGCTTNASEMLRGRVRMTIISRTGRDISFLSSKPGQSEVLLSHGTSVVVDLVEHAENGAIKIWAHEM